MARWAPLRWRLQMFFDATKAAKASPITPATTVSITFARRRHSALWS